MLPCLFYKVGRNCKIKTIQMGIDLDVTDGTVMDISDVILRACRIFCSEYRVSMFNVNGQPRQATCDQF